jgi:DNA-binding MarR family transcriptional regulator
MMWPACASRSRCASVRPAPGGSRPGPAAPAEVGELVGPAGPGQPLLEVVQVGLGDLDPERSQVGVGGAGVGHGRIPLRQGVASGGSTGRFTAAGEALAKPAGQTLARRLVLEAIQDAPATVAQIARSMRLTRQSVQRLPDVLVRDGFAAYEDNPAHRRARLLRLTPAGGDALHTIQAAQRRWADAVGAELGEAELREAGSSSTGCCKPSASSRAAAVLRVGVRRSWRRRWVGGQRPHGSPW